MLVPQLCFPLWAVACQAPLSMGFSRQEYWSGLPFPSPGDLPNPGIDPSLWHCRQILYHLIHQVEKAYPCNTILEKLYLLKNYTKLII